MADLHDDVVNLRAWTMDDVPAIVAACNEPEIQQYLPNVPRPYTEEDARAFVRGEVPRIGDHQFAITANGAVVGSIGMSLDPSSGNAAIGYWCAAEARGR